jgi:hypothetical protein
MNEKTIVGRINRNLECIVVRLNMLISLQSAMIRGQRLIPEELLDEILSVLAPPSTPPSHSTTDDQSSQKEE